MEEPEDDADIRFQSAATINVVTLKRAWRKIAAGAFVRRNQIQPFIALVGYMCRLEAATFTRTLTREVQLDYYQAEPQLLDPHLKELVPPLVERFLQLLSNDRYSHSTTREGVLFRAINSFLYTLCKVRGVNVIIRFFNNEPRFIEPLLAAWALVVPEVASDTDALEDKSSWQQRYVILLWLSHLTLTPFNLSSISSPLGDPWIDCPIDLPKGTCQLAQDILKMCLSSILIPGKEQAAASRLLVRLVLRPDMREMGLLDAVVMWSLSRLDDEDSGSSGVVRDYRGIGILSFVTNLLKSADSQHVDHYLPLFHDLVLQLHERSSTSHGSPGASASMRKLMIKLFRNIIFQSLQLGHTAAASEMLTNRVVLENGIDFFLQNLAARDTQVRYAASKALSVIVTKLDASMAEDVVESILESFEDGLAVESGRPNFRDADASRWHGLTLTLAHLLFRRSPLPRQLSSIAGALMLCLDFEQRSTSGSSMGANVRDAANFGLWSLARRYTTAELRTVDLRSAGSKILYSGVFNARDDTRAESDIFRKLASVLVTAACLDPEGNIRRGSSAALQELVGRHPDTVLDGIDLIQVVDYQAVGLRRRALSQVCLSAAKLGDEYRDHLMAGLFGWRGVMAAEPATWRLQAASSVGRLSDLYSLRRRLDIIGSINARFAELAPHEVEERGALIQTMAEIVLRHPDVRVAGRAEEEKTIVAYLMSLCNGWQVFGAWLRAFIEGAIARRMEARLEYMTGPTVQLISALAQCSHARRNTKATVDESIAEEQLDIPEDVIEAFSDCLGRLDPTSLESLPTSSLPFFMILRGKTRHEMAKSWLLASRISLRSEQSSDRSCLANAFCEQAGIFRSRHCIGFDMEYHCLVGGVSEGSPALKT